MNHRATGRSALGLILAVGLVVALHPRQLPRSTALTDPAAEATQLVTFGLRSVATAMAAYVAVVLLALLLESRRLLPVVARRFVGRWTGHGVAAAVRRVIGASALAAGLVPIAPTVAAASAPPVLAPVDLPADVRAEPTMSPSPPRHEPTERPPDPPPALPRTTITVVPGDSFWSLAAGMAADALGRPPTDAEIVPPWTALIAANRDRLVDPDDPDLLLPGQVLRVPR